jgi:beta-glucosidase
MGSAAPSVREGDMQTIASPADFLGVNYYFPEVVAHAPSQGITQSRIVEPEGVERTAFGWQVSPQGMVDLLERVHRDYAPGPIYLTENGSTWDDVVLPDGRVDDVRRLSYLARHLDAARQVLARGVPLKGYFYWSLLDNFEWAEGYTRRFGLAYVDYATQKRTLKSSGHWYAQFLQG